MYLSYLVTLLLFLLHQASCSTDEDKGAGIHYSIYDEIEILDADNFKLTIFNSSVSWFVEFYTRWCGHCKTFAPTYKLLAKDIKEWQNVVRLGAVDCVGKSGSGIDNGRKLCFNKPYFVGGMPDFRFFPANTTDVEFSGIRRKYEGKKTYGGDGKIIKDSDSLEKVRNSIITFIQETHEQEKETFSLETLKKKDLETFIMKQSDETHKILIIEPKSSFFGREIILDMTSFTGIHVRRVAETNKKVLEILNETYDFEFESSPTVLVLKDENNLGKFQVPENEDPRKYIRSKLQTLPGLKRKRTYERLALEAEQSNETVTQSIQTQAMLTSVDRNKVYMRDLEVALHYSLRKEVSGVEYIQGRNLQALKDYVAMLVKYFPGRKPVMKFLMKVNKSIKDLLVTQMLVWGTWQDILEKADEVRGSFLTTNETYVGCSGSRDDLRGFPCSLWQLFHVLVNQAYKSSPAEEYAIGVLIGMREYILRYFTCMDCRKHWSVATNDLEKVSDSGDAIMYLWLKHNSVNLRLSGSKTDDPMFPKQQWPTKDICPECWDDLKFNETRVFEFLVDFYSARNISHEYLEEAKQHRPDDEL